MNNIGNKTTLHNYCHIVIGFFLFTCLSHNATNIMSVTSQLKR